jgi:acetyl-CoA carboxylase biotin carboxylase subunit
MIGKLIVKADDRETAMRKIQRVVDETVVRGVATSRNFQKALLADPQVQRGEFDTRYLETEFLPRWTQTLPDNQ